MIGIGQPQYLCLDIPQSFSRKFIFFFPIFFSSNIFIVLIIDSLGALRPFRKSEFTITPGPEYASFFTINLSSESFGLTTVFISRLYFFAFS